MNYLYEIDQLELISFLSFQLKKDEMGKIKKTTLDWYSNNKIVVKKK